MQALQAAGFRDDQIGFLSQGDEQGKDPAATTQHAEPKGTLAGAVSGGVVGGVLGGLAAGRVPGIGPILAGGILAGVIGGVVLGGGVGAVAGALIGMGVSEEEAEHYEAEIKAGRTLVTVKPEGRLGEAREILAVYEAHLESHPEQGSSRTLEAVPPSAEERRTIQLREEELQARKHRVQTGEVTLGKQVVSERTVLEVPTTHEEVFVERQRVEGRNPAPDAQIGEGEFRVKLLADQVSIDKRTVVREEVRLGKRQVQETQRVEGEVRREEARMEHHAVPQDRSDDDGA